MMEVPLVQDLIMLTVLAKWLLLHQEVQLNGQIAKQLDVTISQKLTIKWMSDQEVTNPIKLQKLWLEILLFQEPIWEDHHLGSKYKRKSKIKQFPMTLQLKKKRMSNGFHQVQEIIFSHFTPLLLVKIQFYMNTHKISGQQREDSAKNQSAVILVQVNIFLKTSKKRHMKSTCQKNPQISHHKKEQIWFRILTNSNTQDLKNTLLIKPET